MITYFRERLARHCHFPNVRLVNTLLQMESSYFAFHLVRHAITTYYATFRNTSATLRTSCLLYNNDSASCFKFSTFDIVLLDIQKVQ